MMCEICEVEDAVTVIYDRNTNRVNVCSDCRDDYSEKD